MSTRTEAEAILRGVAGQPDDAIDLAEAALALAALERPRVGLDRYRHHLSLLARDVAEEAQRVGAETLEARITALNTVLFERYGYSGDSLTYDDIQNANLMRVIDRRKGLPVAIGILYIHAARAQGWAVAGLNFPGHFLVRIEHDGQRLILDPFSAGQLREAADLRNLIKAALGPDAELDPAFYGTVSNRDMLLRLQNNIKLRLIRTGAIERAVGVIEGMLLFAPDEAPLWHEVGLLHAHLGNLRAAIDALEAFLPLSQGDAARHQAAALLQELRAKLN